MAEYTYFHGDKARYTGGTQEVAGKTFYEIVMVEGHLKGQKRVSPDAPNEQGKTQTENAERFQADFKREQEMYRNLHHGNHSH